MAGVFPTSMPGIRLFFYYQFKGTKQCYVIVKNVFFNPEYMYLPLLETLLCNIE